MARRRGGSATSVSSVRNAFLHRRPAPAVRGVVAEYVGYRAEKCPPGHHRGLPGPTLTTVVSLSEPVEVAAMPDARQAPARFQALVSGLHTAPALIVRPPLQEGLHLDVSPLGARALLGLPAAGLGATVVALDQLLGPLASELVERLAGAPSWDERFAIIDVVLARRLAEGLGDRRPPPGDVSHAWRRLVASGGAVRIADLARELGWSRRHFTQRFRVELGLTPKAAARTLRFDRARQLLAAGEPLALVAARCGYADQAHLTREWNALAGCAPGRWRAEELPNVQDGEVAFPSDSPA